MEDRVIKNILDNLQEEAFKKGYFGYNNEEKSIEHNQKMNYYANLALKKGVSKKEVWGLASAGFNAGKLQYEADSGKL